MAILAAGLCLVLVSCSDTAENTGSNVSGEIILDARSRAQAPNDGDRDIISHETLSWKPDETAIIVTDMWDRHWCDGATERVAAMAPLMNKALESARAVGILVVHAPSDVIEFYDAHPARANVLGVPQVDPPHPIQGWYDPDPATEPVLPIDDSDGGCDSCDGECVEHRVWSRQIDTIRIDDTDAISDDGADIYGLFLSHGIKNVMLMGVHTNMCVLGRPFGIRAQLLLGMNVVLVRDLTDAMYNPGMAPFVSHDEGTALVIEHIERYLAPTVLSSDLLALRR